MIFGKTRADKYSLVDMTQNAVTLSQVESSLVSAVREAKC
jgi:hypothetical protein